MPPKKTKKDFISCNFCGCQLCHSKDLDKHLRWCSQLEPFAWEVDKEVSLKDLHAVIDPNEKILLAPVQTKKNARNELNQVFLNPVVMEKVGFKFGESAVLIADGVCILACVIPLETVEIGVVELQKPMPQTQFCVLAACTNFRLLAIKTAYLESDTEKSFTKTAEFVKYLEHQLRSRKVHKSDAICIRYYGQDCGFTIVKMDSEQIERHIEEDFGAENLAKKVKSLDLSCGEESSFNGSLQESTGSMYSTPLKRNFSDISSISAKSDNPKTICIPAVNSSQLQEDIFMFMDSTRIFVNEEENKELSTSNNSVDWSKIGGLEDVKKTLDCLIYDPIARGDFSKAGIRSILLHGPSGCGKSLLGQVMTQCNNPKCTVLSASAVFTKTFSHAESQFKHLMAESGPLIIFLDDLDVLGVNGEDRDSVTSANEISVKATSLLASVLDNLKNNCWLIGSIRNADKLDLALRRRFQIELVVGVPNVAGRREIVTCLKCAMELCVDEGVLERMAAVTHGYTGSDLQAALRMTVANAAMNASPIMESHVFSALKKVRPSAMREIVLEIPVAKWCEIGGLDDVKMKIQQSVQWPIRHPQAFARLGVRPPNGILLYGPPGCSKTLLARTAASESGLNLLAVKGPEVFSKYVGESERSIRELFSRARQVAPSLIFIDEIDAIAVQRGGDKGSGVGDRVLAQLLTEMDGLEPMAAVVLIAATNRPDIIDKALLRPGRLDRNVYVPLPDLATRKEIVSLRLQKMPLKQFTNENLESLVSCTDGYSGAEVVAVCEEAALSAMRADIETESVCWTDFENALKLVLPRTDHNSLLVYSKFESIS